MTLGPHISQDDLALYAMQALTPEESAIVREHLRDCAPCRDELSRLNSDLALIAMSVEQHDVPVGVRDRFLSRISTGNPKAVTSLESANEHEVVSIDSAARKTRDWAWVALLAAAAVMVIAISLQMQVRTLRDQLNRQTALLDQQKAASARAQAVLDLLNAPAAQHVVLRAAKSKPEPSAKAIYLSSSGSLLLQASNLPSVEQNKTYELWLIPTTGAPIPAGIFRPDGAGNASVVLPNLPRGVEAKAFGVTVEASGGSSSPTLPIVLVGTVPAQGE